MSISTFPTLLLIVLLAPACASGAGVDRTSRRDVEARGSWELPPFVRAAGEAQSGVYSGAGPWEGRVGCATGLGPGTRALGDWLAGRHPGVTIAGFSCEVNAADPELLAMAGTGRVLDIRVPRRDGEANADLGDPIANYVVEHASELGVQFVVWNGTKWNISYAGRKHAPVTADDEHRDHIRVELTPEAASAPTVLIGADDPGASEPPPDEPPPDEPPPDDPPPDEPPPDAPPPDAPPPEEGFLCDDSCFFFDDGECDDGGPGALTGLCPYGTDCFDCGPRD